MELKKLLPKIADKILSSQHVIPNVDYMAIYSGGRISFLPYAGRFLHKSRSRAYVGSQRIFWSPFIPRVKKSYFIMYVGFHLFVPNTQNELVKELSTMAQFQFTNFHA